jgi:hypothetical protein
MGDVRCPANPARMFWKVRDDGMLEVACTDCRNTARRSDRHVVLVLHVYTPAGELVDTQPLSLIPQNTGQTSA